MIADAEAHRAEDARIRAEVDARNELDAVVHQVERRLAELGDQVPVHEKARAENLIEDARKAIQEQAPLDRLRSLSAELQQVFHGLGASRRGRRRRHRRSRRRPMTTTSSTPTSPCRSERGRDGELVRRTRA